MIVQHLDEQVLHPEPIEDDEHHEHAVVRTERYPVKPMYVDEAVLQLEMSHRQFLVFRECARFARERPLPTQERRFRFDRASREAKIFLL